MVHPRGRAMGRFWPGDEEMAKKDDDLGAPGHPRITMQWQATTRPPRRRALARLVAYAALCAFLLFVFFRFVQPGTGNATERSASRSSLAGFNAERNRLPPVPHDRSFNGPIRYPTLADTLREVANNGGSSERNKNILFATATVQSASVLLPMACQMAAEDRNAVHFILLSRSNIAMKDLLEANGIDESCNLYLHDARPDSADISSEARMGLASARALHHIHRWMHPQAIIVDSTEAEEDYFLRAFRDEIRGMKSALIELPKTPNPRLSWITKLDASSLSAWNNVHFDILIQAPPAGSGNLNRLLSSLRRADMSAVTVPHLTIELPQNIEEGLETTLTKFKWPARTSGALPEPNMLSLRHRISRRKLTEEESSVRFLELFWPANPRTSHVLVLAPHTEVSPQFFHYVKYTILHTLYSGSSVFGDWRDNLMGISLQSPNTLLDDTTPFSVSESNDKDASGKPAGSFLWQAPSRDATLFLGDKWAELHGYVSQLLETQSTREDMPAMLAKKEVNKKYPAWLEYALQLARLRGYLTLYPNQETASVILGSHSDLGNTPEEYLDDAELAEGDRNGEEDKATASFDPASQVDMLATLPKGGSFIDMSQLPVVSWEGKPTKLIDLRQSAEDRVLLFRREVGQCQKPKGKQGEDDEEIPPAADRYARDLFCTNKKA